MIQRLNIREKISFFDERASIWDEMVPEETHYPLIWAGLESIGVQPDERVVDLGCGTGIVTKALLKRMSSRGRVFAVDFSKKMIAVSKSKIPDKRVSWNTSDAAELSFPANEMDRVICFSAWPHFHHAKIVAQTCFHMLKPNGNLHIWHGSSRNLINKIHADAGPAVADDVLPPAEEVSAMLEEVGFFIHTCVDNENAYLITAEKRIHED